MYTYISFTYLSFHVVFEFKKKDPNIEIGTNLLGGNLCRPASTKICPGGYSPQF